MKKRSKNFKRKKELISKNKIYDLETAVDLSKELSYSKFEGSIELHINLNLDIKKSEQKLRSTINLPHSTGRKRTILVLAKGDAAHKAKQAGADIVGDIKMIEKIKNGFCDFDTVIATQEMMSEIVKIAPILGPKGLMPNPKTGTVTDNIEEALQNIKKGQITLRCEKETVIHIVVGKTSQKSSEIKENIETVIAATVAARPKGVKGTLIKSAYLAATMSPSIKIKTE